MSISVNPSYLQCPRVGHGVCLEQTEGQCRDQHHCGDEACPLEQELGKNQFRRALGMLSASIGQGWADGRDRSPSAEPMAP